MIDFHEGERIHQVDIEDQMKSAYIDYSMSVIVSRALPDVRDGFKPVHRRVLFGMLGLGLSYNTATKKSARIVGEVLGKYHPHGDSSVYGAMVRMAQDWSLRYPLVFGQGNFGSMDGDSAAAMRYTEARLSRISEDVLKDLDKDTVDFMPNFDESLKEPTVLPTRIPQLLVNGSSGIAVGMATNMAPHNLGEVVDAICAYIDNRNITVDELMEYVKGPDFPTGGIIYGIEGVKSAFRTGRGRIVVRARTEIEETPTGRTSIIVTEIPYQVNKADMIARIAELVNDHKLEGISYINDESNRKGVRVVIILKKDAMPRVVLNNLFRVSQLQSYFSVNNIALVDGRPRQLNLLDLIIYFVRHRHEVVLRRSRFELKKAQDRLHILEGLLIAIDNIDEVVQIIRSSSNTDEAKQRLSERFALSEIQTQAIVDMRLRALTGLERDKVKAEYDELEKRIDYLKRLLADEGMQYGVIKDELQEVKQKYGDARRTEIVPDAREFVAEDFYPDDDVVITISHEGYIKRTNLAEYRTQRRGGRGAQGSGRRDDDFVEHLYYATMHNTLLFFTEQGQCYWQKVYELPEGARNSKGRAMQNLMQMATDDKVRAVINVRNLDDEEYTNSRFVVMVTAKGVVKKTSLAEYSRPRARGVIAITVRDDDRLLDAVLTDGKCDLIMASRCGQAIRFAESEVRTVSRKSMGVQGMRFASDEDRAVGMVAWHEDDTRKLLVVSEDGYCKRTEVGEYRTIGRGGKGVRTLNVEKAGELVNILLVEDDDHVMIMSKKGVAIRFPVLQTALSGRNTKGVHCIALGKGDAISSIACVPPEEDGEESQEIDGEAEPVAVDSEDGNGIEVEDTTDEA